ncbi:ArsR/SmtB family transcription factor [Pedobacter sp. SL55]|uniref:ArsR/SmtB family transcription factor n=1 Tax=Pedobacter sp. SL55 TaxID=2995161 RepID=UPI0022702B8C|nr:metalloregulator ArsR/SmtB family transcription factor [Pedobacter sp. SL55]WAC40403.1 metalloregulator ArsR/SmtB family transcription factor [Pedobacter sp. SL55]
MDQVEVFKALGNKNRLQILIWLKSPEEHFVDYVPACGDADVGVCVGHIQKKSGLTQSTISEYLAVLHRVGLVSATRVGQWTYYKRKEETIAALGNLIFTL